jgi:hypothetical protein
MEEQISEGEDRETDRTGTGVIGMDTSHRRDLGFASRRGFGPDDNRRTDFGLDDEQDSGSALAWLRPRQLGGLRPKQWRILSSSGRPSGQPVAEWSSDLSVPT